MGKTSRSCGGQMNGPLGPLPGNLSTTSQAVSSCVTTVLICSFGVVRDEVGA